MKFWTLCGLLAVSLAMAAVMTSSVRPVDAQEPSSLSPLAESAATDVVTGTVLSTTSVVFPSGRPHWVTEIEVSSTGKGDATGSILVETYGGYTPDGYHHRSAHTPQFQVEDVVELAMTPVVLGDRQVMLSAALAMDSQATRTYSVLGAAGSWSIHRMQTESAARGDGEIFVVLDDDGNELPVHWPAWAQPVPYWINPAGSGLPASVTIAAIRSAFDTWEDEPGSSIRFQYRGTTTDSAWLLDSRFVVSFEPTQGTAFDVFTYGWAPSVERPNGTIREVDILLNSDHLWSVNPAGDGYEYTFDGVDAVFYVADLESVVLHEVGHTIGIAHTFESNDPWSPVHESSLNEVMHPSARGGTGNVRQNGVLRELGPSDTQMVRRLYWQRRECNGWPISVDIGLNQSPTNGDDVILGTGNDDLIDGLGGNDIICGAKGDDELSGSGGDDELRGQEGDDELFGGEGNDLIVGGDGRDRGRGQNGDDELLGGNGNDNLNGNNGNDRVLGQGGNDYVSGRDGEDFVSGGNGNDTVNGGGKSDRMFGGSGSDTMNGNAFADEMFGGDGNDIMSGGDGPDAVNGDGGNDRLDGNRGNDALVGGSGTDICEGRTGFDTAFGCETKRNVP